MDFILQINVHWDLHVQNLFTKANQRLSILRKINFSTRKSLEKLYFSFVRPVFKYADIIWDNSPNNLAQKLKKNIIEAACIVTDATKLASKQSLYQETGWETSIFLILSHHYTTRQYLNIGPVLCKTNHYMNSFLPFTIELWNALPNEMKQNPSRSNFKHFLSTKRPRREIPLY